MVMQSFWFSMMFFLLLLSCWSVHSLAQDNDQTFVMPPELEEKLFSESVSDEEKISIIENILYQNGTNIKEESKEENNMVVLDPVDWIDVDRAVEIGDGHGENYTENFLESGIIVASPQWDTMVLNTSVKIEEKDPSKEESRGEYDDNRIVDNVQSITSFFESHNIEAEPMTRAVYVYDKPYKSFSSYAKEQEQNKSKLQQDWKEKKEMMAHKEPVWIDNQNIYEYNKPTKIVNQNFYNYKKPSKIKNHHDWNENYNPKHNPQILKRQHDDDLRDNLIDYVDEDSKWINNQKMDYIYDKNGEYFRYEFPPALQYIDGTQDKIYLETDKWKIFWDKKRKTWRYSNKFTGEDTFLKPYDLQYIILSPPEEEEEKLEEKSNTVEFTIPYQNIEPNFLSQQTSFLSHQTNFPRPDTRPLLEEKSNMVDLPRPYQSLLQNTHFPRPHMSPELEKSSVGNLERPYQNLLQETNFPRPHQSPLEEKANVAEFVNFPRPNYPPPSPQSWDEGDLDYTNHLGELESSTESNMFFLSDPIEEVQEDEDSDSEDPASESTFYQLLGILTDVNTSIIKSVLKKVLETAAESFFKAVV